MPRIIMPTDEELDAAMARGKEIEPLLTRITSVVYDRVKDEFHFTFNNKPALIIPRRSLQWVASAHEDQLLKFELLGNGTGISWPALDADFSAIGLVEGRWGTPSWTRAWVEREPQTAQATV